MELDRTSTDDVVKDDMISKFWLILRKYTRLE